MVQGVGAFCGGGGWLLTEGLRCYCCFCCTVLKHRAPLLPCSTCAQPVHTTMMDRCKGLLEVVVAPPSPRRPPRLLGRPKTAHLNARTDMTVDVHSESHGPSCHHVLQTARLWRHLQLRTDVAYSSQCAACECCCAPAS